MVAGVIVFVLLLALGWIFFGSTIRSRWFPSPPPPPPPPLVVAAPIQTVTFSDGSALTISAVADSAIVHGTNSSANGGGKSRGYGNLMVTSFINDGAPVYQNFSSTPGDLLLACRLLDASGVALRPDWVQVYGNVFSENGRHEKFSGWKAMAEPGTAPVNLPDVMVQLSDGIGGWIDGSGPVCAPEDPVNRCVLAFSSWPRSTADLYFRAIRPGLPSVSWKIKNPLRKTTPAAWTPDALPKIHTDPEFELEFLGAITLPNQPNTVQPRYRFTSKVPGDNEREGLDVSYQCACVELLGALGTRSEPDQIPHQANPPPNTFHLPPDETMLRFRFTVTPSYYFPYRRDEAALLLKGKLSADGKSITLDPSIIPDTTFLSATFEHVEFSNAGSGFFTVKIEYTWNGDGLPGGQIGEALRMLKQYPVCFVGNSEISSGFGDGGINGHSSSHGRNQILMNMRWNGNAKPGDEITIGMTIPRQAREVIFTTPRPTR